MLSEGLAINTWARILGQMSASTTDGQDRGRQLLALKNFGEVSMPTKGGQNEPMDDNAFDCPTGAP